MVFKGSVNVNHRRNCGPDTWALAQANRLRYIYLYEHIFKGFAIGQFIRIYIVTAKLIQLLYTQSKIIVRTRCQGLQSCSLLSRNCGLIIPEYQRNHSQRHTLSMGKQLCKTVNQISWNQKFYIT